MNVNNENNLMKTHVNLNVSNIDRSIEFYESFFGETVHKRRSGYANFDIANPPIKLALQETSAVGIGGPLNHLGIVVPDRNTFRAKRQQLIDSGLKTMDEEQTTCCFAVQDKVWVSDPDGNAWEVYVLVDDMMDSASSCATEGGSNNGCCLPTGMKTAPISFVNAVGRR